MRGVKCCVHCRYGTTVTSMYTPSCFMVALSSGAATTALSDVDECSTNKRKRRKRSIVEDKPFASTLAEDIILPSRSPGVNNSEMMHWPHLWSNYPTGLKGVDNHGPEMEQQKWFWFGASNVIKKTIIHWMNRIKQHPVLLFLGLVDDIFHNLGKFVCPHNFIHSAKIWK